MRHREMLKTGVAIPVVGLMIAIAPLAHAADGAGAEDANEAVGTAPFEIVVTGEKQAVSLQKAPLAISVIMGDDMLKSNIREVNDLNGSVPGLTIAKNEGTERIISLRGIGYETPQVTTSQPGVAFHIDGIYISHVMALNQDMLDVERIEVLRGPQGTVFGQASTGGAINVIPKKPVLGEVSGMVSGSYGNYDFARGVANINMPLGDTLAVRASAQYLRHDGYAQATKGPNGNYDLSDANDFGARLAMLWQPSDRFTALLAGQMFHADRAPAAQKHILDPEPRKRYLSQDAGGYFKLTTKMAYLNMEYDLDFATVKSSTGYQEMGKRQANENDRLAYVDTGFYDHIVKWTDDSRTWTQELSLASAKSDSLSWIVGAFYLNQNASQYVLEYSGTDANPVMPIPTTPPAAMPYNLKFMTDMPFHHESVAVYGQGTLSLTDDLRFTAGLRHTWYKTTGDPLNFFGFFGPRNHIEVSDKVWSGKLGVEYNVSPANMLYATLSRGFKPAGVNRYPGASIVPGVYKEETVTSYEVGSKNTFFDRALTLNMAGFYYDYKNMQYLADDLAPNSGGAANLPKVAIWGAEVEATLRLGEFRLSGNLTLLDGEAKQDYYTLDALITGALRTEAAGLGLNYYNPATQQAYLDLINSGLQNTKGAKPPKMPSLAGTANITWAKPLSSGTLTTQLEMQYRGKFNYRIFNNHALDKVPAYTLFNVIMSYKPEASPWEFSATVKNLLNSSGINSRFTDPYGSQTTSVEYIDPQQFFATVTYKF